MKLVLGLMRMRVEYPFHNSVCFLPSCLKKSIANTKIVLSINLCSVREYCIEVYVYIYKACKSHDFLVDFSAGGLAQAQSLSAL